MRRYSCRLGIVGCGLIAFGLQANAQQIPSLWIDATTPIQQLPPTEPAKIPGIMQPPNWVIPTGFEISATQPLITDPTVTPAPVTDLDGEKLKLPAAPEEDGKPEADGTKSETKSSPSDKTGDDEKKAEKDDKKKDSSKDDDKKKEKKWFEKYTIRGYAQLRYNEILTREDFSAPPQYVGDRSVGEDQTFFLRRARVIIQGDVSEHMGIYLQPDFASTLTAVSMQSSSRRSETGMPTVMSTRRRSIAFDLDSPRFLTVGEYAK